MPSGLARGLEIVPKHLGIKDADVADAGLYGLAYQLAHLRVIQIVLNLPTTDTIEKVEAIIW
jgi:hypothetical protein